MVKVVIRKHDESLINIRISGHAYSGEPGHDLVCAGISAITTGILNSLEDVENGFKIIMEEGLVEISPQYVISPTNTIILSVLVTSLQTIEESYGKYIKIRIEKEKTQ